MQEDQTMLKNPILWTVINAIFTVLVYLDTFFWNLFLFTIPLALLVALIATVVSIVQKQYVYIFLNIPLAIIACLSYVLFPW